MNKDLTKKVILYLINRLGDEIEGKKKLMKLMFLVEHYDPNQRKLVQGGTLGNTFSIYHYGVFSIDVMHCVDELIRDKTVKGGFPLKYEEEIELRDDIQGRVESVIEKFGDQSGYKLETETLKMLGIEPSDKEKYFGEMVSKFIKN